MLTSIIYSRKTKKVGEKVTLDFLTAYRGHMMKVKKELEFFKQKTSDQEYRLKTDEHVLKIQKSLDWFRQEALDLGKQTHQFKSEALKWKSK
jgi:hypothetical protein